jgi:hypothetical protein
MKGDQRTRVDDVMDSNDFEKKSIVNTKKTNIYIIDDNIWNWVKSRKNELNLQSLSEYIFRTLSIAKETNLELKDFLLSLEKYFEYGYYDMDLLANDLKVSKQVLVQQINSKIGKIPLFGSGSLEEKKKALKIIHEKMMSNKIMPRELSIAHELKTYVDSREPLQEGEKISIPDDILMKIIFPNESDRRFELYNYTLNMITDIIQKSPKEKNPIHAIKQCKDCDRRDNCRYLRPDLIYLYSGIEANFEDIREDLITEVLNEQDKSNSLRLYGIFLEMGLEKLIGLNLKMVKEFVEKELFYSKTLVVLLLQVFNSIEVKFERTKKLIQDYFERPVDQLFKDFPVITPAVTSD